MEDENLQVSKTETNTPTGEASDYGKLTMNPMNNYPKKANTPTGEASDYGRLTMNPMNNYPKKGNEDFIILDGGDVHKVDERDDQKRVEPLYFIIKIPSSNIVSVFLIFWNDANYANLEIMQRLWAAFSTLHLFFMPALLCLTLGFVSLLIDMKDDISHVNALNSVMISLFGVSVFVGLPLHVLALGELEDALYEAEEIFMRTNVGTQTADDNLERDDSDTGQ